MRLDKTMAIARREYVSRIQSKGFWMATLAIPVLTGALIFLPSLLISRSRATQRLVVLDDTGQVTSAFRTELERGRSGREELASFEVEEAAVAEDAEAQREDLDEQVRKEEIDAWLWVPATALEDDRVEYHAESVSNVLTQRVLDRALTRALGRVRLEQEGYDADAISELTRGVELATVRVSGEGAAEEEGEAGFWLAYALFFLLYLVLVLYGQQVLNGVLEEKSSRIVEVVVASVRPFELMLGKLLGIGGIGLTQLLIWLGTLAVATAPTVVASLAWLPSGTTIPALQIPVLLHFVGHFLLGFFLFSTLYAAIGSAFNNLQEAQQMSTIVVLFLVAPMVFFMLVLNDPDSTFSVVASLIPPFTPLLMLLRIAVKMPPWWQIGLGYLLTSVTIVGLVAVCGRIYRVGILMYGKKPTLPEMIRWMRYG